MIAGEGDAEPSFAGGQHGAARAARLDEVVHGLREVELAVEPRPRSEECGEQVSQGRKDVRLEPPEVGADGGLQGHVERSAGHVPAHGAVPFAVSGAAEFQPLGQPPERARFVDFAEAPGDAPALREGDFEGVADGDGAAGGGIAHRPARAAYALRP